MTAASYPLFPLFRSRLMAEITNLVFTSDAGHTISELASATSSDRKNVRTVVDSLVEAGVFTATQVGRSRLITANESSLVYRPLLQLLTIVQGPPSVIARELSELPEVRGAFIYGSWAARAQGIPGSQPRDIDLLVITRERVSPRLRVKVVDVLDRAAESLGRPVNPTFATLEQWTHSEDRFLQDIKAGPMVEAKPLESVSAP